MKIMLCMMSRLRYEWRVCYATNGYAMLRYVWDYAMFCMKIMLGMMNRLRYEWRVCYATNGYAMLRKSMLCYKLKD